MSQVTTLALHAPISGLLVPLNAVPDAAFAERLAGDGVAIDPLGNRVVAPCDARVLQVHRANHAVTLAAAGLEILIHVGLDTVMLRGEGFHAHVRAGDEVRRGDLLLSFDADAVARRARSLVSPMVVTNPERVRTLEASSGRVTAGADVVLRLTLAEGAAEPATPHAAGPAVESPPIVVRAATGLHARPAAVLAAAARRFGAEVRIVKGDRDANLRSIVSVLALEVSHGDSVSLVARGGDAASAVVLLGSLLASDFGAEPAAAASTASSAAPAPALAGDGANLFAGVSASPGVAIGEVVHLAHEEIAVEERATDPVRERRVLDEALSAAHAQLEVLRERLAAEAGAERAAIFGAHQELLEDPEVIDRAAADIRDGATAAYAWRRAYLSQAERLFSLGNPLLAGRAADLRDVGRRVLQLIVGKERAPHEVPAGAIVIAEELAPSDAASLDRTRVAGLCTVTGSATSHAAIIARGLGIPAVCGIDPRVLRIPAGTRAVLDGDAGTLHVNPTVEEEREILHRQRLATRQRAADLEVASEAAVTRDGHRIEVGANVGDLDEASRVVPQGGEGIGLLRTEFLFMDRREPPDEDEQARSYEDIVRAVGPDRLVVIRTLDVGGDKPLAYLPIAPEANPFLGERGIRASLTHPSLFRAQIRAILRASAAGRVAIMFPMVATLEEWRTARAIVNEERAAIGAEEVPLGIMVETASAALLAGQFARDAAFLSIGTNDLTQYTLAMDRTNARLAPQLDALHPAVLHLIERTVAGARAHGRWVGVCGALAGDLAAVPVLLGLGVDELSCDLPLVPAVKARVRALSMDECRRTACEALAAGDAAEVRAIVAKRHA